MYKLAQYANVVVCHFAGLGRCPVHRPSWQAYNNSPSNRQPGNCKGNGGSKPILPFLRPSEVCLQAVWKVRNQRLPQGILLNTLVKQLESYKRSLAVTPCAKEQLRISKAERAVFKHQSKEPLAHWG
eukprot:1159029-Pelagomonas_calceolata.AAC.3